MIYFNELKRITRQIKDFKRDLENELKSLPEGEFYCYEARGSRYYSERMPKKGNRKKERRQGVKKDKDKLYALVRKEYVTNALATIDKDLQVLESALKKYKPFDMNSIMEDFLKKYPELNAGIYYGVLTDEQWANNFTPDGTFYSADLKSTAEDGSGRRSLGEIIIGSRLKHYGISYRYEAPIDHPDIKYIPDFTIKRPRDGKIIYWEHLGKVTDVNYMDHNRYKFSVYEEYGIVPWDNLIISYSQSDGGINEKLIDSLIQGWLL